MATNFFIFNHHREEFEIVPLFESRGFESRLFDFNDEDVAHLKMKNEKI